MVSNLLGYWPGEWSPPSDLRSNSSSGGEGHIRAGEDLSPRHADMGDPRNWPAPRDTRNQSGDELYFDAPSTPLAYPAISTGSSSVNSWGSASPSLVGVTNTDNSEWRSFHPPAELLYAPPGTPMEIDSVLEASIEILQDRLVEEDRLRDETALQQGGGKGKGKETMIAAGNEDKDQYQAANNAAFHPSNMARSWSHSPGSKARISDTSNLTASSTDSGYASGFSDGSPLKSLISKGTFIGSFFRRSKDKPETPKQSAQSTAAPRECVSCLEDFEIKELVSLECHSYCKPCFQNLISNAIGSEIHWPPKCCLNEIPPETVLLHLPYRSQKRYKEVLQERSVPAGERIYCSKPTCGVWIPPSNIKKATLCAACPACRTKSCISCRGAHHGNGDCSQDPSVKATLQLASDEGWRRCYSCKVMVEHNQGCIHMTCKCKAQFCYICGLKWRTCTCADAQLGTIRAAAEARRRQAEAREQVTNAAARAAEVEADELREIIQMIEEYEMEEAALLAQEEEAIRRATQETRQRKEEARVMSVSKRYFELNKELELLHSLQKVAIAERYENDLRKLQQAVRTREETIARHNVELQLVDTEGKAKISDSLFEFEQDFQARIAKELQIEDDYARQLTAYWSSRPGGDVKITEGKESLRNAHTASNRQWEAERRTKHQQIVNAAKEALDRIQRRHEAELAALENSQHISERNLEMARNAGFRWLEAVAVVRLEMMRSMEEDEYAWDD